MAIGDGEVILWVYNEKINVQYFYLGVIDEMISIRAVPVYNIP